MMTSKEAIRILELYNPFLGGDDKKILSEAIELAIEALKTHDVPDTNVGDLISREALCKYALNQKDKSITPNDIMRFPAAQPETYKEKLKEIADALSEKFAYMNTCLNERDIILGYLGVSRPSKTHCNTDCTNIKCESYRYNKRLPPAQREGMRRNDME